MNPCTIYDCYHPVKGMSRIWIKVETLDRCEVGVIEADSIEYKELITAKCDVASAVVKIGNRS